MRRTLQLCRLGLAGAATVAVLSACAGTGNSNTASSKSATTTSSAATTTAAAAAAGGGGSFCDQARAFGAEVSSAVGGLSSQDATAGTALQQALGKLQAITPPDEIAADWQTALNDLQQLAAALQSTNLKDPASLSQLEQKVAPLEDSLTTSGEHIDQYLQTKCGISINGTTSSTS